MTHEQADFDALGALLGATLLTGSALPVTPRRLNRNARSFLTLYGQDLPFVDAQDLPQEAIEQVTLVDTQSLVTLRGLGGNARVNIVDHHPARADLDPEWNVDIEKTGASTTIFTERLQDLGYNLSLIQATLLLLGIYEDTGSLSYTSTTPRDVRAAAYLLEQGASLNLAANFLNPPLSADQRLVYEELLKNARTEQINGQTVIVSCANAGGLVEEISSIAHKIRDLLDPDALFILVETSEGIRIVARSTSNQVNVAKVMAVYGGGGHDRAAAALIHPGIALANGKVFNHAPEVEADLLSILPTLIHPATTVGQIMSRKPHLLNPETSAQEASALMQKYGYEGYPVIENGRVIGLLTRREVDRALSHKLNLPAASLMEAGTWTVFPTDSLDSLQKKMTESGWGQIPVIHPETNEIMGIVTRTDLLKILSKEPQQRSNRNLAQKLEAALPASRLALLRAIAETGRSQQMAVYIVGGFVRDLILGRPSLDFDVVVEGDAIALAKLLASRFGGHITSHSRFGTAKWSIGECKPEVAHRLAGNGDLDPSDLPESLDLISARTEFYDYPTALPKVERSSIKLDLHRRDFTINTLALRLDGHHYGELLDFWGGLNDLHRRLVRVLHSLSFIDDPTRALRAVRFEQRFHFSIEARTLQLLKEARGQLKQVTGDRLRHELDLILAEERAIDILNRLAELDLLHPIHPGLDWNETIAVPVQQALAPISLKDYDIGEKIYGYPTDRVLAYLTWFGQLPLDQARAVGQRLHFSGHLMEDIVAVCRLRNSAQEWSGLSPSQIVSRLEGLSPAVIYCLQILSPEAKQKGIFSRYARYWKNLGTTINGHDLESMGIPPGEIYRTILHQLRNAWLDGIIHSGEEERQYLAEILSHAGLKP